MEEFDQQGMGRKRLLSEWLGHNTLLGPKRNNPIKLTRNTLKKFSDIIIIVSFWAQPYFKLTTRTSFEFGSSFFIVTDVFHTPDDRSKVDG